MDFKKSGTSYLQGLWRAAKLFHKKGGMSLAAASTFYVAITVVPLLLLFLRLLGLFMQDVINLLESLFTLALKFFPDLAPHMALALKDVVKNALFAQQKFTVLNLFILGWSGMAYFNSLWRGLYVITDDQSMMSFWNYVRGMMLIATSVLFMSLVLVVPPAVQIVIEFLTTNPLVNALREAFPMVHQLLAPITKYRFSSEAMIKSQLGALSLFFIYFIFLFRGLFNYKVTYKSAALGSLAFMIGLTISRSIFWIYMRYVREGLIRNYGDYYTLILGLVWVYFVMGLFYFGLCACFEFSKGHQQQGSVA